MRKNQDIEIKIDTNKEFYIVSLNGSSFFSSIQKKIYKIKFIEDKLTIYQNENNETE
mgnify:CR=1 FL=1